MRRGIWKARGRAFWAKQKSFTWKSLAEILKPPPRLPLWRLVRVQQPHFESNTAWERGAPLQR